ncbi:hypothetical protein U472_03230 [Orenia metallireducens]|uniref:Uncharacterized protein n=1 Tax=Orenia metallireducens TaxID=1413210 RepID=A0A1C0AB42_9FIRM|nr:hypothetical protein [Orenia metallireducens]OCL27580.1 hypothetical protein U472_03230 [Orenia metallireducens]
MRTETIITHNSIDIPLSDNKVSEWFICKNYNEIIINLINHNDVSSKVEVEFSSNGLDVEAKKEVIASGTGQLRNGKVETQLSFFRVKVYNEDSN